MEKKNTALRKAVFAALSGILVLSAAFCTALHIAGSSISLPIDTLAAETTLSSYFRKTRYAPAENSSAEISAEPSLPEESISPTASAAPPAAESSADTSRSAPKTRQFSFSAVTEQQIAEYDRSHEGEQRYPVAEFSVTKGDTSFGAVQVKNASSLDLDIKKELESGCSIKADPGDEPQVLIYHTHTSESFLDYDMGYFYESFYARSEDKKKNVCAVGEELASQLSSLGIKTLHDTTVHDSPGYSGAYYRSTDTVEKYLKKYPSIKVVLDIHRDGLGSDTQRSKPVCRVNGRKAAQIMILAGYNYDGDESFDHWEENLRFALKIQERAQETYPGLMRPVYLGDFMYNMNICGGSLLIEIGADSNTVDEARYSGYLLAEILAKVLKGRETD